MLQRTQESVVEFKAASSVRYLQKLLYSSDFFFLTDVRKAIEVSVSEAIEEHALKPRTLSPRSRGGYSNLILKHHIGKPSRISLYYNYNNYLMFSIFLLQELCSIPISAQTVK